MVSEEVLQIPLNSPLQKGDYYICVWLLQKGDYYVCVCPLRKGTIKSVFVLYKKGGISFLNLKIAKEERLWIRLSDEKGEFCIGG